MNIHFDAENPSSCITDSGGPFFLINPDIIEDLGFEVVPPDEYEAPEDFPECCGFHRSTLENTKKWLTEFPLCCDNHRKLVKRKWFDKEKYDHVPDKVVNLLSYCEHQIAIKIDGENWYREITDYFEYCAHSFGTPSIGSDRFAGALLHYIKKCEPKDYKFPNNKRELLIAFFNNEETVENKSATDLNKLNSIYQRWIKAFPNLSFFKGIKEKVKSTVPMELIVKEERYNPYLELSSLKIRTETEFVDVLEHLTGRVLNQVDVSKYLLEGVITDKDKYNFDLVSSQHKIRQETLLGSFTSGELKYVKIIKSWLSNEKEYFKTVEPLLSKLESKKITSNNIPKQKKISNPDAISIFVTYAWDQGIVNDNVSSFVNFLRESGYNASFDQSLSEKESSVDFNELMSMNITESDKVIVVLSSKYKSRADGFIGGVGAEYRMILEDIKKHSNKYIFVSFNALSTVKLENIRPLALGNRDVIDLKVDQDENDFQVLHSKIQNKNRIELSEISESKPEVVKKKPKKFEL